MKSWLFFHYNYLCICNLKLNFIIFKFSGLSHDNNTNNSTNDGMDIEWRPKKEFYLESYSGRLITSMRSAFFYFLLVTTISSERKKKELSTIFVWENSVLGRNKTKIVKKIVFALFFLSSPFACGWAELLETKIGQE